MEQLQQYIKPELIVLIPVLIILGTMLKKSNVEDKHIPVLLSATGIILSILWVIPKSGFNAMSVFTAITQGILCAGASVLASQIQIQNKK